MSHVVLQAAEFPSVELAVRCETELRALIDEYVQFEATDPDPWGGDRVPPPLVAFGKRHGVDWPTDRASRFAVKGLFVDEARLRRVDRMVFFWAGGFDLGGETLRSILVQLGAQVAVGDGHCHLEIRHEDPDTRVEKLESFLLDEDFEDQFTVGDGEGSPFDTYFSITFVGPQHSRRIEFDDSGVQDWAFVALIAKLGDADPTLLR